jgi:hypothetical protein
VRDVFRDREGVDGVHWHLRETIGVDADVAAPHNKVVGDQRTGAMNRALVGEERTV